MVDSTCTYLAHILYSGRRPYIEMLLVLLTAIAKKRDPIPYYYVKNIMLSIILLRLQVGLRVNILLLYFH